MALYNAPASAPVAVMPSLVFITSAPFGYRNMKIHITNTENIIRFI
jgi:hypothetical protein